MKKKKKNIESQFLIFDTMKTIKLFCDGKTFMNSKSKTMLPTELNLRNE
jgi:hypothetical protein